MRNRRLTRLAIISGALFCTGSIQAKDVIDTLYSSDGDRIILTYSINQDGAKTTVLFTNVQKKLGSANQRKYRKLDEVAVAIFDRTGSYNDTKFEGMTPSAFMIPAGVSYTPSDDGFFLLGDNPQLTFTTSSEAQMSIPVYLTHYEKKRHYKVFSQCGNLEFSTKVKGGGGSGGGARASRGGGDRAANADDIIVSEELTDEGLTPTDDAMITIANVKNQLAGVTKLPFPEDLTFQANHLRELRSKIADMEVLQDINDVLAAYDRKKAELEEGAAAEQQAAAAAAQQAAKEEAAAQQAKQDSIQAAQEKKADEDKKGMMWLIGGIAGAGMLLMFGKQIFQTIKNNKMQRMMMDNINKAQQQALSQVNIPGMENNPLGKEMNQMVKKEANKKMTAESNAAKEKLASMMKGGGTAAMGGQASAGAPAATSAPAAASAPANPAATSGTAAPATSAASGTSGTPGKRPLRKASEVRAAAGLSPQSSGLDITVKPQHQSMNDVIPAKYKRWRKPGTPDSNK
jgi:hypothetical protein